MPEPWLRAISLDVHPALAASLFALQQAEEDLHHWTEPLTDTQMWDRPHGLAPIGFQIRHIGGSLDRLTTYLQNEALTEAQLTTLEREMEPGATRAQLLEELAIALERTREVITEFPPPSLKEARYVGRKRIPTTAVGLIIHMAEHTQRHVGQMIVTARVLRA
jgi:hypothetical protein